MIKLAANQIYNHKKRLAGMTIREIAHSLQYIPKAEMLIGAWIKEDGETLLSILKDTLTWSMADNDICPALTLGLHTAKEQSGIVEDTIDHKMMMNILKKYLSRWHTSPKHWKTKKVKKLTDGVEDEKLNIMITSPGGVQDLLKANAGEHKIDPPTFFFFWDMDERKAKELGVIEHMMIITEIPDTLDPETFIPSKPLPRNGFSTRWIVREMILKSTYVSETDITISSPFTQVECRQRWGKVYLHLYE